MIVPGSRNSGRQRSGRSRSRSRSEKFILPRWHSILGLGLVLGLVWAGTAIRIGLWNLYQTSVVLIEVTDNSSSILVQWSPSSLSEDRSASNVATRERRVVWSVETTFDGDEDKDSSTDKVDTVTQLRGVRR